MKITKHIFRLCLLSRVWSLFCNFSKELCCAYIVQNLQQNVGLLIYPSEIHTVRKYTLSLIVKFKVSVQRKGLGIDGMYVESCRLY